MTGADERADHHLTGEIDGTFAYVERTVAADSRRPGVVGTYRRGFFNGAEKRFVKDLREVVRFLDDPSKPPDKPAEMAERIRAYMGIEK